MGYVQIHVSVMRPAINARILTPDGRTTIVGGGDALTVDDDYATYARRTFVDDDIDTNELGDQLDWWRMIGWDLDSVERDPDWDSGSETLYYEGSTVFYRGYSEDNHFPHQHSEVYAYGWNLHSADPTFMPTSPFEPIREFEAPTSSGWYYYNGINNGSIILPRHGQPATAHPGCAFTLSYLAVETRMYFYRYVAPPPPQPISDDNEVLDTPRSGAGKSRQSRLHPITNYGGSGGAAIPDEGGGGSGGDDDDGGGLS